MILYLKHKIMKDLNNLNDLLLSQISSLHHAEIGWQKALRQNMGKVHDPELKSLFEKSSGKSVDHAVKLEGILISLNKGIHPSENLVVRELINQANAMVMESNTPEVLEAALIASHQQMNHYKIASYGTAAAFAKTLGQYEVADILHKSLLEEKLIDEQLSKIATGKINFLAKSKLLVE